MQTAKQFAKQCATMQRIALWSSALRAQDAPALRAGTHGFQPLVFVHT